MSDPHPERPQPPEETGGKPSLPARAGGSRAPGGFLARRRAEPPAPQPQVRPELQNWQVLDVRERSPGADSGADGPADEIALAGEIAIDGEAHLLDDAPIGPAPAPDDHPAAAQDQVDAIVIAGLPERRIVVLPGSSATLVVSLLNNGPQPAIFDVHVEGWVHELWLPEGVRHVPVHPGERVAATITIAPPRQGAVAAGEFPIYVVVRSPQHLRRATRLAATLVILPFTEFGVGRLSPSAAEFGFFRRRAAFLLPISNLGNHPLRLQAQGQAAGLPCTFEFRRDRSEWQPAPVLIDLKNDETIDLLVRATLRSAPMFATRPQLVSLRVSVGVAGELRPPRSAPAEAVYTAPVKLWHLLVAGAGSVMLLALAGLLAIAARLLLAPGPDLAAAAAPAPAPVVIVLNQAPPQAASGAAPAVGSAPPTGAIQTLPPAESGAPVVRADQITGPGEPAPRSVGGPRAPAADSAPLTYAQMFQEIALHYDLDWRLLAAQAYVESSFDTMALGSDGDMGLMQVLPSTWREWAPAVGATDPFDAYSNTLVAAAYLDHVRALMGQRGLPQAQWMLVGYNWGPDRLTGFVDSGGAWEQLPAERAQYATDILNIARTIP